MHSTRYVIRPAASTCGGRAAARCGAPYNVSRGLAHWAHSPSYYGRFSPQSDFASLFRIFDDASSRAFDNLIPALANHVSPRAYQPRFDIKEVEDAYELRGELPGVQGENLSVEFTDPQTLIIKGRTERESTSGAPAGASSDLTPAPAAPAALETDIEAADSASDTASVLSASSYQKPSVEDAEPEAAESSAAGAATPTSSVTAAAAAADSAPAEIPQQEQNSERYWVSERSVGEFQRTFKFSANVDQEGVSASLKDGILSVHVPKAQAPAARKIDVQL